MNTSIASRLGLTAAALASILSLGACSRQSRGNADAETTSRAQSPQEGAGTSTEASAGQAKNFGDTTRSGEQGSNTDPNAAKAAETRASNAPQGQSPEHPSPNK
jgi:hypothetical protein